MPIKIQNGLPARAILESENVFIMDEDRAESQDIRPLEILILNLMPLKEDTETQLLRALSNTPLQVECTYMTMSTHESTHTSASHLNKFYVTFPEIKKKHFDGMIITGAPVELMEFEEVNYWEELTRIMEQDPCDLHHAPLLGCTGGTLLPLRDPETLKKRKAFRCVYTESAG